MGRKAKFQKNDFLDAALSLLSKQGLKGVTIAAIAKKVNAPVGSVYHRFASREILMAELWIKLIESFQTDFIKKLESGDGLNAALYVLEWARKHPKKARVLMLYRREELITGNWPDSIKAIAEALKSEVNKGLGAFAMQFFGQITKQNLGRVLYCLVQVPTGAVRDFIQRGEPIPDFYDQLIRETHQAVLLDYQTSEKVVKL